VSVSLHLAMIRPIRPRPTSHIRCMYLPPNQTICYYTHTLQSQFYTQQTITCSQQSLHCIPDYNHICYHCKVSMEPLNSSLPRFLVDAFAFFQMFVSTFAAKCAACCPPEVTLISIHWACQLCLTSTATLFRTVNENLVSSFKFLCGHPQCQPLCAERPPNSALWMKMFRGVTGQVVTDTANDGIVFMFRIKQSKKIAWPQSWSSISGNTHPATHCHIPKHLNLQQHWCEHLKLCIALWLSLTSTLAQCTTHMLHSSYYATIALTTSARHLYQQWTNLVILAKHWLWLPDDGFFVKQNMLEQPL